LRVFHGFSWGIRGKDGVSFPNTACTGILQHAVLQGETALLLTFRRICGMVYPLPVKKGNAAMSRFSEEQKGMLAATAAYVIFGFSYLFSKMALNVTEPFILLLARFTTTFLVLNLLVLTGVCKIRLKGKNLLAPILVGILQPCLYFVFENYGLAYTTTSFTGIDSSISPVFTIVLGALILK
jgi:hypothetical protein